MRGNDGMKRWQWTLALTAVLTLLVSGCGPKSAEDVVADLGKRVEKMESYKGAGKMTLLTGEQPIEYSVEVWYKKPHFYRVSLTNAQKDIQQIVLRNDEGVFVLTPHLKKSFRFQSGWPQNQGQVYLMQTLAQSITDDQQRKFAPEKDAFTFEVAANYQNSSLARQKIRLSKGYAPQSVEVYDQSANKLVQMTFDTFEYDVSFDDRSFQMQENMMGWLHPELSGDQSMNDQSAQSSSTPTLQQQAEALPDQVSNEPFGVIEPTYAPEGVNKHGMQEFQMGEHRAVMLRYSGTYHYTLTETRPETRTVTAQQGRLVDLGHTLGVMLGEEQRTLTWTDEGVEYRLTTAELPEAEMIKVAQSVFGQIGK
jgi:outer membrane lipoprotein-sorting protein